MRTRTCQEPECGVEINIWRACGYIRDCKIEMVYCDTHGGDHRAVAKMIEHVEVHRGVVW